MNKDPRRVLIIATPVMGDVLLCTPLMRSIRAAWPETAIDVLTRPGGAAVLEGNPDVDDVIELHKKPPPHKLIGFLFSRFRKYDVVLSNSASDRAFGYSLIMGKQRYSLVWRLHSNLGIKQRFYDGWVDVDEDRYHTIPQNLKLIDTFGIEQLREVTLPRTSDAAERLVACLGRDWESRPYAVLHADTAAPIKRWNRNGWHETIAYLARRGLRVLVTGGPADADRAYIDETLGLPAAGAESLAGKLRLGDVTVLLESASVYVGVDTLITHMAAAAGAPTIAIFGPISPVKWGPWPQGWKGGDTPWRKDGSQRVGNVSVVRGVKQCQTCGEPGYVKRLENCRKCLETLNAAPVIAAIEEQLGRPA